MSHLKMRRITRTKILHEAKKFIRQQLRLIYSSNHKIIKLYSYRNPIALVSRSPLFPLKRNMSEIYSTTGSENNEKIRINTCSMSVYLDRKTYFVITFHESR